MRRYLIPRTAFWLYYQVTDDVIEILAFWHASRGSGPPI